LIAKLPLIVTVDTSVVHLAGALAVDAIVAVSTHSDLRWQVERTNSDCYPTIQLVRQQRLDAGDTGDARDRTARRRTRSAKLSWTAEMRFTE
jgi:ADP-heptose:LPS heptosyltransferase